MALSKDGPDWSERGVPRGPITSTSLTNGGCDVTEAIANVGKVGANVVGVCIGLQDFSRDSPERGVLDDAASEKEVPPNERDA